MPRGSGNPNHKTFPLSDPVRSFQRILILRHGLEEIISLPGVCPVTAPEAARKMVEIAKRTLSHAFDHKGA